MFLKTNFTIEPENSNPIGQTGWTVQFKHDDIINIFKL